VRTTRQTFVVTLVLGFAYSIAGRKLGGRCWKLTPSDVFAFACMAQMA
jgi:hypothetical protein